MKRCFSTCFKRCKKKKIPEVYVLLLENNKFYVGESMNKGKRIQSHRKGHGSAWTRQNKIVNSIPPITNKQESFWELKETLEITFDSDFINNESLVNLVLESLGGD